MSTKDFIKKSVLNAFTQYDAPKLAVALLAALALGILIYLDHEDERKTIAQNGLKKIVQYHTYEHRIDVILKTVL